MIKHLLATIALISYSAMSMAVELTPPPVLDTIVFQLTTKQWVLTQTALLHVSVNATLTNHDLVKARAEVMTRLNKIAKGDWHVLNFDRSQDNSGLEKLVVEAQARVDQASLTDIYQNAKSVSVPGAQYQIGDVEFKPSLEEMQTVKAAIREKLYQQINDEILRINKTYPGQNYSLNQLTFMESDLPPPPANAFQAKAMNAMVMTQAQMPITVSNELSLTAVVEVASNRKVNN